MPVSAGLVGALPEQAILHVARTFEVDTNWIWAAGVIPAGWASYDCAGGSGDSPEYTGPVQVVGSDPHDLDADGDGFACE